MTAGRGQGAPRGGFSVEGCDPCHLGARLVLATGVRDAFPDVEGFFTRLTTRGRSTRLAAPSPGRPG